MLVEKVVGNPDVTTTLGWTIVDIDNWLEGNHYWIKDRLHPPSANTSSN
jgi:hypothetical protein